MTDPEAAKRWALWTVLTHPPGAPVSLQAEARLALSDSLDAFVSEPSYLCRTCGITVGPLDGLQAAECRSGGCELERMEP